MFLKTQQKNEYRGIEAIFEILEDQRVPEHEKMPIVLSVLRQFGLEEECKIEPTRNDIDESENSTRYFMPYRIDKLSIPILNCVIPYTAILN